jgi:hypothetical protein
LSHPSRLKNHYSFRTRRPRLGAAASVDPDAG